MPRRAVEPQRPSWRDSREETEGEQAGERDRGVVETVAGERLGQRRRKRERRDGGDAAGAGQQRADERGDGEERARAFQRFARAADREAVAAEAAPDERRGRVAESERQNRRDVCGGAVARERERQRDAGGERELAERRARDPVQRAAVPRAQRRHRAQREQPRARDQREREDRRGAREQPRQRQRGEPDRDVRGLPRQLGLPPEAPRQRADTADQQSEDDGDEQRGHRASSTTKSP